MAQSNIDELAGMLERIGYRGLMARRSSGDAEVDPWSMPDAGALLVALATDEERPWRTRFLAAETILDREMFLLRPEHHAALAPVYARALAENATGSMADWGFLAGMGDVGRLGGRFILFGMDADAVLRPMLNDLRGVPYIYPPSFPSQLRTDLRIADFAALYLSAIHKVPIALTGDPAQRDREIDRLRRELP